MSKSLLLFICATMSLQAQPLSHTLNCLPQDNQHACNNYAHFLESTAQAIPDTSAQVQTGLDVLHYDIFLDWSSNDLQPPLLGTVTAEILLTEARDSVFLDAHSMEITSIEVDGQMVAMEPFVASGSVGIDVSAYAVGDTIITSIQYVHNEIPDYGLHSYRAGTFSGQDELPANQLYTLGAPDYTRYWVPCHDNAFDKATVTINTLVNEKYTVAANGTLDSTTWLPGSGRTVYHWSMRNPVATYLLAVHASEFDTIQDMYVRDINDTVPLQHFVWAVDSANGTTRYDAYSAFSRVPEMMSVLSERFGDYPFEKYGMAVVQPFFYYAMENQTMVTVNRTSMSKGNPDEEMFMHELFHQWMGDYVTPATWNDIWINEGAATWSEALWNEHLHGPDGYRIYISDIHNDYLFSDPNGRSQPPLYRNIPRPVTSQSEIGYLYNYPLTYQKGALVWHMLRRVLGDEAFYGTMQTMIAEYADGAIETHEVAEVFAREHPEADIDMTTFFDQWVYGASYPDIEVCVWPLISAQPNATAEFIVEVKQNSDSLFTLPLDFERIDESGDTLRSRLVIPASKTYNTLHVMPMEIYDSERTTLNRYFSFIGEHTLEFKVVDVTEQVQFHQAGLLKLQTNGEHTVTVPALELVAGEYAIEMYSLNGELLQSTRQTIPSQQPWTLQVDVAQRLVMCNIANSEGRIVQSILVQK